MMKMKDLASAATKSVTPKLSGRFEEVVLVSLLRLGCTVVGCSARTLRMDIESRFGEEVSIGVLYATLGRLEERGFISSELAGPTGQPGIRSKRLFTVTEAGRHAVLELRFFTERVWEGFDGKIVAAA